MCNLLLCFALYLKQDAREKILLLQNTILVNKRKTQASFVVHSSHTFFMQGVCCKKKRQAQDRSDLPLENLNITIKNVHPWQSVPLEIG